MARVGAVLAVAIVVVGCGEARPPSDADASIAATCEADITVTGGYEGRVTGPVSAAPRRIGDDGAGLSIDAFLDMPQDGVATRFLFSIFDPDGPDGSEPTNALFGAVDPVLGSRGWVQGMDPGIVSLAANGSNATFDLEFGRIGVGPAANVRGSIDCPKLP
jgi:hypothetical protein